MLKMPLAAAVTLGLLFCGATVGLEAVGLLFHAGDPDPQQRVEAFVARLEADLSPVDLPTEPVELPREAALDLPVHDEPALAAEPALDGEGTGKAVEAPERVAPDVVPDGRGDERLEVAVSSTIPSLEPDTAASPDEPAVPYEAAAPMPLETQESVRAPLPAVHPASPAPAAAAPPAPQATPARRERPALGPKGYAAFGWPVLDWLVL